MQSGPEKLLEQVEILKDAKVGVCCNHTAVAKDLVHILSALKMRNVNVRRVFGPEHGVDATAQDMISVEDEDHIVQACVSLYGDDEASLHPDPETLADLDIGCLIFKTLVAVTTRIKRRRATSWRSQRARIRAGYWTVPIRLMVWL